MNNKLNNKDIKITSEGLMNGYWQITIKNIRDWKLYDTEVAVLKIFGRKKKKLRF